MTESISPTGNGQFSKMKEAFNVGMELEQEETKGISRFKSMCEQSHKIEKMNRYPLLLKLFFLQNFMRNLLFLA